MCLDECDSSSCCNTTGCNGSWNEVSCIMFISMVEFSQRNFIFLFNLFLNISKINQMSSKFGISNGSCLIVGLPVEVFLKIWDQWIDGDCG
jgi:hypothetical protein